MLMFQCPRPFMAYVDNEWRTGLESLISNNRNQFKSGKKHHGLLYTLYSPWNKKGFSSTVKAIEFRLLHRPED